MEATIIIRIDVRQWIEENDMTIPESQNKIMQELLDESDNYEFGSLSDAVIHVSVDY